MLAATGLVVITSVLLAIAAWRLSQGPIELVWLSNRAKAILSDDTAPVRISFKSVMLAWEGFQKGVDYPLDLRIADIVIRDPMGKRLVSAPQAHLTFSAAALLLGRFVPRAIEVDQARIAVTRGADGTTGFGGSLTGDNGAAGEQPDFRALRDQLARPAGTDHAHNHGLLDQIRRVHFRNTEVTVTDQKTGLILTSAGMDLDIRRPGTGHIIGTLDAPLRAGDKQAELTAKADFVPDGDTRVDIALSPVRLAGIDAVPPALAVTAPVSLVGTVALDRSFAVRQGNATLRFGAGAIPVSKGVFPLQDGIVEISGTSDSLTIQKAHFNLARQAQDAPETLDIAGALIHAADRFMATMTVTVDQIDIADLPRLWPDGVASATRSWVVHNVTAGLVRHGFVDVVVEADIGLHHVALTKATGDLEGSNATFTWIDNIPPVEQTEVRLHLVDPDTLDILVPSGRQRTRNGGGDLLLKDGRMRITGLAAKDQFADIATRVEGSVSGAWSLLKEPQLHLLSTHPIGLKTTGGDVATTLTFQFPLNADLQMDDVRLHADAHVRRVRLLDIVHGNSLDDGAFDLDITKDGLNLKGRGTLAAIPLTVTGTMDFNSGPPDQVVQKIIATGDADAAQLDAAGLHVTDVATGPMSLTATLAERRNGQGSVTIDSDLTRARLTIDPLAWSKSPGSTASATATLQLLHDRLSRIDRIAVRGDSLLLTGSAEFTDGQVRSVLLDRIRLGETDARGAIHFAANTPIAIALRGPQIDLAPKLTEKSRDKPGPDGPTTPGWTLDGHFDRALLAHGERASDLLVKAGGDGGTIRFLDAIGTLGSGTGFSIRIDPQAGKRHLRVTTKDAGSLLRGLDAISTMQSGQLTLDANFGRPVGYRPLAGTAEITDVTVKNSPVLGKLLQAVTLYGLVDALRGPGMAFTRVTVPFQYNGTSLSIDQARAYNSSLGLTAKGTITLPSGRISINGTIVPAYFFNAMLGRLPFVGKLFSPEEGGGVFAARFGLEGPIDDAAISVNPISALTPGFLREIFGVFDNAGPNGQPAARP
ncbi:MAG: AsmA-like C-terminal region-containing protein [Rhodopila sp.]